MNKLIIAALALGVALTSCNKGTISSKRLDGTWKLASGTGTSKTDASQTNGGTTTSYTTTSSQTWNGSTLVTVTTSNIPGSLTTTTTGAFTSEWTFTKDDDKFTSKSKMDYTYEFDGSYYASSDCSFSSLYADGIRKTTVTTDATATGLFTVLGATGEIEKNSRILTETTSETSTTSTTYAYFNGTTAIPTPYMYSTSGCVLAGTSAPTTTNTNTDVSDAGTIVTVSESTKSEMTITSKNVNTSFGSGTDKTVTTSESTLKYTKN